MSLIAILVGVMDGSLKKETLRWNHVVKPEGGDSMVDHAFNDSWEKLNAGVGFDVESIVKKMLEQLCEQRIRAAEQRKANTARAFA